VALPYSPPPTLDCSQPKLLLPEFLPIFYSLSTYNSLKLLIAWMFGKKDITSKQAIFFSTKSHKREFLLADTANRA
jgi:hypothetical protein